MKKFVAIVLTLSLFLVIGAVASVAYPWFDTENFASFDVQDDGSVIISLSKDTVEDATGYSLTGNVYITIYDEAPSFTEDDMMTPFNAAQAGSNNVGRQGDFVYKVNVGQSTAKESGEYPFEDGETYYFIFCFNVTDKSVGWTWTETPVTFVYEAPAADDEVVEGTGNYPSTNADWGINAVVQEDGSVLITYDKEKVNASKDGWSSAQANIAIYDEDPQFTAASNMTSVEGDGQDKHPYSDASVGLNNAGQTSAGAASYLVAVGTKANGSAEQLPTYPFEEGHQY